MGDSSIRHFNLCLLSAKKFGFLLPAVPFAFQEEGVQELSRQGIETRPRCWHGINQHPDSDRSQVSGKRDNSPGCLANAPQSPMAVKFPPILLFRLETISCFGISPEIFQFQL
jgi:hypothetical protein